MKELLDKLYEQLILAKSPLADLFQPGISKSKIGNEVNGYNLRFSDDFLDLYLWRNGILPTDNRHWKLTELFLFSYAMCRPFEEFLILFKNGMGQVWPEYMFPVFESGAGEVFLLDCRNDAQSEAVFILAPTDYRFQGLLAIYDSLQSLVKSVIECYKNNAYYYDPGSYKLQVDYDRESEINARNNPKSEYWKLDGSL